MNMSIMGAGSSNAVHGVSGASSYAAAASIYQAIDTAGAGSISKEQLNQASQSQALTGPPGPTGAPLRPPVNANTIFNQLKTNSSGNVSRQNFISGMSKMIRSWRNSPSTTPGATGNSPAQTLSNSLQSLQQLGGSSAAGLGNSIDLLA